MDELPKPPGWAPLTHPTRAPTLGLVLKSDFISTTYPKCCLSQHQWALLGSASSSACSCNHCHPRTTSPVSPSPCLPQQPSLRAPWAHSCPLLAPTLTLMCASSGAPVVSESGLPTLTESSLRAELIGIHPLFICLSIVVLSTGPHWVINWEIWTQRMSLVHG